MLRKPVNQDVVVAILETIGGYFKSIRVDDLRRRDIEVIERDVNQLFACARKRPAALGDVLNIALQSGDQFRAMVARANYLALDRVDIQFTVKELTRRMASPTEADDRNRGEAYGGSLTVRRRPPAGRVSHR